MTDDLTRLSAGFGDAAQAPAPAAQPMTRREARAAEASSSRRALREAERAAQRPAVRQPVAVPQPVVPVVTVPAVPLRTRVARKVFPPVVMAAAAALIIGTSVPSTVLGELDADAANASVGALATASALDAGAVIETTTSAPNPAEGAAPAEVPPSQVLATSPEETALPVANRDDWSVTSYAELMRLQYGNRSFMYATTGSGAVRWPFPFAAEISSGFGNRSAPCRGCSSYHQGLDFVPGYGTPIQSIADGVVKTASYGGGYGQHVVVEHVINGQKVTTLYAHMVAGSTPVRTGETISAGTMLGTVGNTGISTGAHLHFELHLDGVPVDPFAWLTTNAS